MLRALSRTAGSAALIALSACTFLLKTDVDQCTTDADCTARGGAFAQSVCVDKLCTPKSGPLSCVGNVQAPPAPGSGDVSLTMTFIDVVTAKPLGSGITVRPCAKLDVGCAKPLSAAVPTDNNGVAAFSVPSGFDGYLEINSPNTSKTVPALWYFSPLPIVDRNYNVLLLSPDAFEGIARTVGATIDPQSGHTFNIALDCTANYGVFASGVSFAASPTNGATRPFYLVNGLPNTDAHQTDSSGIGGFANLAPGVVTVTSSVAESGARIGSVSTLIRAGVITYAPIAPSP